ncbi:MAG: ATP-binding protein [Bacteroidales bacterium]
MKLLSSLTNRIFLASAALAMLCTGTAIYLVNARVTASAEEELQRRLRQTGALVDQQRATVSGLFTVLARTVADLPKLKAAVDTHDPPTVQPIAAEYREAVHADMLLVDDQAGRVLGSIAPPGVVLDLASPLPSVADAHAGREGQALLPLHGALLELISVPIAAGEPAQIVGTLTLGFLLDDALAGRFKQLTGSEIAFAVRGRVVASTLAAPARPSLEAFLRANGRQNDVAADGEHYVALRRPLDPSVGPSLFATRRDGTPRTAGGRSAETEVVILRSRSESLRLLRPIQAALLATGLVAVLLAIALSYTIARTITRPLAAITDVMKQMAATGDLTRKIDWQPSRWDDEDAQLLARTFNTLTGSITRFQREAAERERLSARGRLSTVIAHEVRNPLMIIKASLRPLTRGSATPTEVREAAADIDEEVQRLNRLTNEVLDFARPMRFDLAPVDLAELCEAAATAAGAGFAAVSIRVTLDRTIGLVVTDAERLRSALVNVIVNACHAVTERATAHAGAAERAGAGSRAAAPPPDVQLVTQRCGPDRFEIVVRDGGIGIEASELPRVFDPYFTTKRAGTGLGLAITRNIIEGLGGAIRVTSQRGVGTEVRIELPVDAA